MTKILVTTTTPNMKSEVKYVPGENGKFVKVTRGKIKLSRLSLLVSMIALGLALVLFSLLLGWLWGVPNKLNAYQQEVDRLEHLIHKQENKIQKFIAKKQADLELKNQMLVGAEIRTLQVEDCLVALDPGPCTTSSIQRWFYDVVSGSCRQFSYGGCQGNKNNFITLRDCQDKCRNIQTVGSPGFIVKDSTDNAEISESVETSSACFEKPSSGPCRGQLTRYFWDNEEQQCSKFLYGGCSGNKNNFVSSQACNQACNTQDSVVDEQDKCGLEADPGNCTQNISRWFFDGRGCRQFGWSGCGGNANNFLSKERCEVVCPLEKHIVTSSAVQQSTENSECSDDILVGDCRGAFKRFYYNQGANKCDEFLYGGCGGNKNNFMSLQECQEKCLK